MQKFLEDTLSSRYIKALLRNTYLPNLPTVSDGDPIIKDCTYVYGTDIIKCTRSGYIQEYPCYYWNKYRTEVICKVDSYGDTKYDGEIIDKLDGTKFSIEFSVGSNISRLKNKYYIVDPISYILPIDSESLNLAGITKTVKQIAEDLNRELPGKFVQVRDVTWDFNLDDYVPAENSTWSEILYIDNAMPIFYNEVIDDTLGDDTFIANHWYLGYQEWYHITEHKNEILIDRIVSYSPEVPAELTDSEYMFKPVTESLNADYKIIGEYKFGEPYPRAVNTFFTKSNLYDTETHLRLGKYLRFLRDTKGIDLMPFYNCNCNKYTSRYTLDLQDGVVELLNNDYKILQIPIKFDKVYTIAVDCPSQVICMPAFIEENNLVKISEASITTILHKNFSDCRASYAFTNFTKPFTYELPLAKMLETSETLCKALKKYEKYLYLLIQLPIKNDSSVTVIEGNYTNTKVDKVFDQSAISYLPERSLNELLISKLSLLKINDHTSYAFSDRLIEYLLDNVITKEDEIPGNIKRVQDSINYDSYFTQSNKYNDIWEPRLRRYLFMEYQKLITDTYDINGYVDKDIENYLRNFN